MDLFMKKEILDNLPDPKEVTVPAYFERTITEEKEKSGLSDTEIDEGESKLISAYSDLKNGINSTPPYSDNDVYIAYIDRYLKMYYPRMFFILNHLLKYTKFYEILKNWSSKSIKILDIGAGPGNMFMAFIEYLEYINELEAFDFTYEISLIEEESNFIGFSERLLNKLETSKPTLRSRLSFKIPLESRRINFNDIESDITSTLKESKYQIIILSFILNENEPDLEKNKTLFKTLSDHLEDDGLIIFIGAASDYIRKYFNIDFKNEMELVRLIPCFNSNELHGNRSEGVYPFFGPCGDLCTFQISPAERHRFSYVVLSKKDIVYKKCRDMIENTLNFYNQYEYLAQLWRNERDERMKEISENCDIFGIFSDRMGTSYYICNGACKYKVIDTTDNININEGDLVIFRDLEFDGIFPKKKRINSTWIRKNYNEVGFKYQDDSSFKVVPYFLEPED